MTPPQAAEARTAAAQRPAPQAAASGLDGAGHNGTGTERWVVPEPVEPVAQRARLLRATRVGLRHIGLYPAGTVVLVLAIVGILAGRWLHWDELVLMGVAAGLLVVLGWLMTIGRARFAVDLQLQQTRVVVGTPADGHLVVTNARSHRSFPARIDLQVGDEDATFTLPSLAARAERREAFAVPTHKRGVVPIGPAKSVQGDPFGLAGRETRWTGEVELFVHPRTVSLPGRLTGFVHDLEGHSSQQLVPSDMSFHALREYAPGDERRHIHWRSSARTGRLMVRQFEETRQSRVVVALDTAEASYLTSEEFELSLSVAASAALQCVREENPLALMTMRDVLPAMSGTRVLDELTRVNERPVGSLAELLEAVVDREPAASVIIVATGSVPGLRAVQRACQVFDVDTRVIAVVADLGQPVVVRTLSNVSVIQLGTLTDLPQAVRRVMA